MMVRLIFALAAMAALCVQDVGAVGKPGSVLFHDRLKNLVITPLSGRSVLVGGIDVVAGAKVATSLLEKLESMFKIVPQPIASPVESVPIAAFCLCPTTHDGNRDFAVHAGQCTPAVRFASGMIACCAASTSKSTCRWTASNASCQSILLSAADAVTDTNAVHGFHTPPGFACHLQGSDLYVKVPRPELMSRDRLYLHPTNESTMIVPLPGRTVILASLRITEWLDNMASRLTRLENRTFGLRAAPRVSSVPTTSLSQHPGHFGLDTQGNVVIEPLVGQKVIIAGRDVVLELHHVTVRLANAESALAKCPCLALARCTIDPDSFNCVCNAGYGSSACTNVNECVSGAHNCNATSAICSDTTGSFTCACKSEFSDNGANCAIAMCGSQTHNCHATSATCIDIPGSFTCACHTGFTGDGITCALIFPTLQWARQVGSTGNDMDGRVAVDNAGRVFLVGTVVGATDGLTFAGGPTDAFLIAFNGSTGTRLWSQLLGSNGGDNSLGVAADGDGNVYIAGFTDSGSLDGQVTAGRRDVFLVRYDSRSGGRIWTRLLGAANSEESTSVVVDPSNPDAVHVGGHTESATGSGLPGSAGGVGGSRNVFVARYARNGERVWVCQFGSSRDDQIYAMAMYQSAIYVTGQTTGVMAGTANTGGYDMFIARISVAGAVVWTAQLGSAGDDCGRGLAVDSSGVYVSGYAYGSLSGQPFAGANDAFVARYTHGGVWEWTQLLGTSSFDASFSLALDRSSNVLITGVTRSALGGQTSAGDDDVFVASFTSSGTVQWVRHYGTTSSDTGISIVVDGSSGAAYVVGMTSGSMYGQPSVGGSDFFLLNLQYACAAGFTGNGITCTNVNECAIGAHNCNVTSASCSDTIGSFICACNFGFTGDGLTCTLVIPTLQWARQTGSAGSDDDGLVAVDEAGRVFLVGWVVGASDGHAYAGGSADVYLVAYNASTGTKIWSQILGSSGDDYSRGVAADGAGSVYVTGYTTGSNLDGQVNVGGDDVFLVRYDSSSGTQAWTRLLGTASSDHGYSVAINRSNPDAIYVGGHTLRTTGGGLPGSAGGLGGDVDAFVARFAKNGSRVWVRQFGSSGGDACYAVAVYQSEIYATGTTSGVMAGTAGAGSDDVFVVKITTFGVVTWTAQLGSTGSEIGQGIAVDSSGVYVTGYTTGSLSGQPYAGGNFDIFVAQYSHAGVWAWTRMLGTNSEDVGHAVTLGHRSNVLIAGRTGGALSDQTNAGNSDVFVASFTSNGTLLWARLYGTALDDYGYSIAVDGSSGAIYVASKTGGSMYGQPSLGILDLVLLKLQ